jgi:hypothetical protein
MATWLEDVEVILEIHQREAWKVAIYLLKNIRECGQ